MTHKIVSDGPTPVWLLVFETGDEVMQGLTAFATEHELGGAHFIGLGAMSEATLAFFDPDARHYEEIAVDEQVEVLTITGNLARLGGEARVHAHAVLGRRDGSTLGGHLQRGVVRPTLEVFITALPGVLERRFDPESGLPLLAP